jgi:hypothetical protein
VPSPALQTDFCPPSAEQAVDMKKRRPLASGPDLNLNREYASEPRRNFGKGLTRCADGLRVVLDGAAVREQSASTDSPGGEEGPEGNVGDDRGARRPKHQISTRAMRDSAPRRVTPDSKRSFVA